MKTANLIRQLFGWTGDARLYKLDTPIKCDPEGTSEYVVVSATNAYSGPETYIFACNSEGKEVNYSQLDGSERGFLDHTRALRNAGYEVTP